MNVNMLVHRIKYMIHMTKLVIFDIKMNLKTPKVVEVSQTKDRSNQNTLLDKIV